MRVLEEGLPGRTTSVEAPNSADRNGLRHLPVVLETHSPLDLLIVMLGTNDLKCTFNSTSIQIGDRAAALLHAAVSFQPKVGGVLLVSPPHVAETPDAELSRQFAGAVEKSSELAAHYKHAAAEHGCHFFDAASVARSDSLDGIHLDEANHKSLGLGIARELERIFSGR